MKKTIIFALMLGMLFAVPTFGQGMTGKMMITAYGGYSLGFGDAFDDYELFGLEYSSSAGITFGGIFHYGVNEKLAVGGELMFQSYKFEVSGTQTIFGTAVTLDESDTETEMAYLFNGLYAISPGEDQSIYLMAGAGMYDFGDSEFGLHGGIMYSKMLSPQINLYVAPRFHMIMADSSVMLLQVAAGVTFMIGG